MSSVCTVSQPAQNQTHPAACCTPINIKRGSNIKLKTIYNIDKGCNSLETLAHACSLIYILELCTHIVYMYSANENHKSLCVICDFYLHLNLYNVRT